jgi:hypothetical protein
MDVYLKSSPPNVDSAFRKVEEDMNLWEMAGAKSLSLLMAPIPGL